jgi:hypothetical protein
MTAELYTIKHSRFMCDCRRGMHWWTDLLMTYTHHLEIQVIILLLLVSTIHKSSQHSLSLFQSAKPSSVVPWQRHLAVEILQLPALRSYLHGLPCTTAYQLTTDSQPGGLSHHPPSLLFTAWLSTDNSHLTTNWVRVRVTLRLEVNCQSVRLGDKPLETHDQ